MKDKREKPKKKEKRREEERREKEREATFGNKRFLVKIDWKKV